ncbi:MAG: glycerate kinase [Micropepsaceae bacterium]
MYDPPQILRQILDAAIASCHPSSVVAPALPARPAGRIVVVGAGKASAAMAAAVEEAWGGPLEGAVVTRYGHGAPTRFITVTEAQHPLPDAAGLHSAEKALELVTGLTLDDTVLALLSGGGSALWSAPLPPVNLSEKQSLTRSLVLSGAPIGEINCVRKHLSKIKGGRLAAAAFPARILTLAISDVVSDDPSVIASGPTTGDHTTTADALAILQRLRIAVPQNVLEVLNSAAGETIKAGDKRLSRSGYWIIARGSDALSAACDQAHRHGIATKLLGVNLEGDARQLGRAHGEIARNQMPVSHPVLLVSGGELTVKVSGSGKGGPNREYLMGLAKSLQGAAGIWALAADTDGIDGSEPFAGGWIAPDTLEKARRCGVDVDQCLAGNDSARFFAALNQHIETGPTRTNVNDLRAILLMPQT